MKILNYKQFLEQKNENINEGVLSKLALIFAMATSTLHGNSQKPQSNSTIEYKILNTVNNDEINKDFDMSINSFDQMNIWLKGNFDGVQKWKYSDFMISTNKSSNKLNLSIERKKDESGYNLFIISCNRSNKEGESTKNILSKNPGSKILTTENNIVIGKDTFTCHLIGININTDVKYNDVKKDDTKKISQEKKIFLDDKAYQAIYDFETTSGLIDKKTLKAYGFSKGYNVHQNDQIIKDHIDKSIGFDTWYKIPMKFRMQIFSYMFNSDSYKDGDRYRWIAGLAQSLNPNKFSDRKTTMSDPKEAIEYIKGLETKDFEEHYKDYLNVLHSQYASLSTSNGKEYDDAAKELSWFKRPGQLDKSYGQ